MMAEKGCGREYKRDWPLYNEKLVERGRTIFEGSDKISCGERKENGSGTKRGRGRPRKYDDILMAFVCGLKAALGKPYRSLEGILDSLFEGSGTEVPCYSTLWKRCNEFETRAASGNGRKVTAAVDSTGIKVTVRGEWIRQKWKVRRGWLKLHVISDTETNEILAFIVTDERSGDAKHMLDLVDAATVKGYDIVKVLADGAYDTRKNWNGMKKRKIWFVTNIRKNASTKSNGCPVRAAAVRERDEIGDKEWKELHGYNMRWKVESVFSDLKRMFGEYVRSRTFGNMVKEIGQTIECFNRMKRAAV